MRVLAFVLLSLFGCLKKKVFDIPLIPEERYPIDQNSLEAPRTMIVSHFTLDAKFLKDVIPNHQHYAKLHHYDYWFRNGNIDDGRYANPSAKERVLQLGLYWQKVEAIDQVMAMKEGDTFKYEWIFWIDGDAVFTDMKKSFEDLRNEVGLGDGYFLITKDKSSCVNAGVFLIKNDERGRQFMHVLKNNFAHYKDDPLPEQTVIEDIIFGQIDNVLHKTFGNFGRKAKCGLPRIPGTLVVEQTYMNAFYPSYNPDSRRWRAGMFIAHFAGDSARATNLPNFAACIAAKNYENLSACEAK